MDGVNLILNKKVRNKDREDHQKKPTHLSGFLFIQELFSSQLFRHHRDSSLVPLFSLPKISTTLINRLLSKTTLSIPV